MTSTDPQHWGPGTALDDRCTAPYLRTRPPLDQGTLGERRAAKPRLLASSATPAFGLATDATQDPTDR
jgi:hypothetical protein